MKRALWALGRADQSGPVSAPNYLDIQSEAASLSSMSALQAWPATLTGAGVPQRVKRNLVSDDLFATVGVEAALGRTFLSEEREPGAAPVVVIGPTFWM